MSIVKEYESTGFYAIYRSSSLPAAKLENGIFTIPGQEYMQLMFVTSSHQLLDLYIPITDLDDLVRQIRLVQEIALLGKTKKKTIQRSEHTPSDWSMPVDERIRLEAESNK